MPRYPAHRILAKHAGRSFSKIAKGGARQQPHEAEASGKEFLRHDPRRRDQQAGAPAVSGWRRSDAARKKIAEAAEAGETALEAHLGYGMLAAGEEKLGAVQARLHAELVGRQPEHAFKPADEMEWRHA